MFYVAYETLSDPKKKRAYDSQGPFDDSIPSADSAKKPEDFYSIFGEAFDRNARWSSRGGVPGLGDDKTPVEQVQRFYNFWFEFKVRHTKVLLPYLVITRCFWDAISRGEISVFWTNMTRRRQKVAKKSVGWSGKTSELKRNTSVKRCKELPSSWTLRTKWIRASEKSKRKSKREKTRLKRKKKKLREKSAKR